MGLRVCIYGTGAIGGLIAARLAGTDANVTCVARGSMLDSIRANGLRLIEAGEETTVNVATTDAVNELGIQDIVIVALKTHALRSNAGNIAALLGSESIVVTAQNGLPWWYFYQDSSAFPKQHLDNVDPSGEIWQALKPHRAIGAVVYPAATVTEPRTVQHLSGNRFSLGEPNGELTPRLELLAGVFESAGFEISRSENIRAEMWLKLSVNAAVNPLSLIHGVTIGAILDSAPLRTQLLNSIAECQAVAARLGIDAIMTPEQLLNALEIVRGHKTSMLIDFEQGRTLELDALTGAVVELADALKIPCPLLSEMHKQISRNKSLDC